MTDDDSQREDTATGVELIDDPELRASFRLSDAPSTSFRARVLVVEGPSDDAGFASELLPNFGFEVRATADGVLACQWLATLPFDVALLDVQTEGLGGLELLRFVREHHPDLPVILMTHNPTIETASQAVEYGAFQYLRRPLGCDQLEAVVERAFKVHQTRKAESLRAARTFNRTEEVSIGAPRQRWMQCLSSLYMAYQPIVQADGAPYGFEALLRTSEPGLESPLAVLDLADELFEIRSLSRVVRSMVATTMSTALSKGGYVFVNLHPNDLLDPDLFLASSCLAEHASRVVLEITERAAVHDLEDAREQIARLRQMGFRVALDDLGAGYAGLSSFVELRPDIVKLDMSLVRGVDADSMRRKLVRSLIEASLEIGAVVVGEGIETREEQETLVELGCHLLQGYRLGRPARVAG